MNVRKSDKKDASRIAEIFVFNNRVNYFPIFKDANYSFGELQVTTVVDKLLKEDALQNIYVYDDGIVKGFICMEQTEICKLYVDTFFQSEGIGQALITYAIDAFGADRLWALEKNTRAISFYERHGFRFTGQKLLEEGTAEYLLELRR